MSKSWGILGEATPEQIRQWQNLPFGKFKSMVDDLKKKHKGKSIKKHTVEVKLIHETHQISRVTVPAIDYDHAVNQVRVINKSDLEWSEKIENPDPKFMYRVINVE